jgi:hypothetical protein
MSTKTPIHYPKPDKAGYNRKWTDVAFKKYKMGMGYYRAQGKLALVTTAVGLVRMHILILFGADAYLFFSL